MLALEVVHVLVDLDVVLRPTSGEAARTRLSVEEAGKLNRFAGEGICRAGSDEESWDVLKRRVERVVDQIGAREREFGVGREGCRRFIGDAEQIALPDVALTDVVLRIR